MTPNFESMSTAELRAYAIEHREELKALRTLFKHRDSNGSRHQFPDTEEGRVQLTEFFQKMADLEGRSNNF
jgi:hypothetical protein